MSALFCIKAFSFPISATQFSQPLVWMWILIFFIAHMHSLRQLYPTIKPNHIPEWLNLTEAVHFNLQASARKRKNRKCLGRRVIVQKQRLRFVCWCFWNCRSRPLALLGNFCRLRACTKVVVVRDDAFVNSLAGKFVNRVWYYYESLDLRRRKWIFSAYRLKVFELLGAPYIYVPSRKWRWRGRK